jgi:hypothetical protein
MTDDRPPEKPSYDELEAAMLSLEEMLGRLDQLKTFSLMLGQGLLRLEFDDEKNTWTVSFPERPDKTHPIVKGPGDDFLGAISEAWQVCYDRAQKHNKSGRG